MCAMECRQELTMAAFQTIILDQNRVLYQAVICWIEAVRAELILKKFKKKKLRLKATSAMFCWKRDIQSIRKATSVAKFLEDTLHTRLKAIAMLFWQERTKAKTKLKCFENRLAAKTLKYHSRHIWKTWVVFVTMTKFLAMALSKSRYRRYDYFQLKMMAFKKWIKCVFAKQRSDL